MPNGLSVDLHKHDDDGNEDPHQDRSGSSDNQQFDDRETAFVATRVTAIGSYRERKQRDEDNTESHHAFQSACGRRPLNQLAAQLARRSVKGAAS